MGSQLALMFSNRTFWCHPNSHPFHSSSFFISPGYLSTAVNFTNAPQPAPESTGCPGSPRPPGPTALLPSPEAAAELGRLCMSCGMGPPEFTYLRTAQVSTDTDTAVCCTVPLSHTYSRCQSTHVYTHYKGKLLDAENERRL